MSPRCLGEIPLDSFLIIPWGGIQAQDEFQINDILRSLEPEEQSTRRCIEDAYSDWVFRCKELLTEWYRLVDHNQLLGHLEQLVQVLCEIEQGDRVIRSRHSKWESFPIQLDGTSHVGNILSDIRSYGICTSEVVHWTVKVGMGSMEHVQGLCEEDDSFINIFSPSRSLRAKYERVSMSTRWPAWVYRNDEDDGDGEEGGEGVRVR